MCSDSRKSWYYFYVNRVLFSPLPPLANIPHFCPYINIPERSFLYVLFLTPLYLPWNSLFLGIDPHIYIEIAGVESTMMSLLLPPWTRLIWSASTTRTLDPMFLLYYSLPWAYRPPHSPALPFPLCILFVSPTSKYWSAPDFSQWTTSVPTLIL